MRGTSEREIFWACFLCAQFYIYFDVKIHNIIYKMPGSKGLNPHELAHKWMKDLGIRPNMSLKVGKK